jgi:hypothetical protein
VDPLDRVSDGALLLNLWSTGIGIGCRSDCGRSSLRCGKHGRAESSTVVAFGVVSALVPLAVAMGAHWVPSTTAQEAAPR